MYDYIIIGGGISGLYMNYLLTDKYKTLLLEKNNYFGGRALNINFHGNIIRLGAGIGAPHNKSLLKLLKDINIKSPSYKSTINIISDEKVNMREMVNQIIKKYKSISFDKIKYLTAKEFIIKYFGKDFFTLYSTYAEYTDFVNSSMESFIKYYPIIDHIPSKYTIIGVDWMILIEKLINYIEIKNKLEKNYEVKKIVFNSTTKTYNIDNKYETKNIIFAITIKTLTNILKQSKMLNINYKDYNDCIGYVPFIRIYSYHKNGHNLDIKGFNIVNNKLQNIIIMNDNLLMITYSDSVNALYWKKYIHNKKLLIEKLTKSIKDLFKTDIIIDDIYTMFWEEGVHYYKPTNGLTVKEIIKKLSNPAKNIFVCGEMLSIKQGWVEGSIQSANHIYKIINK